MKLEGLVFVPLAAQQEGEVHEARRSLCLWVLDDGAVGVYQPIRGMSLHLRPVPENVRVVRAIEALQERQVCE